MDAETGSSTADTGGENESRTDDDTAGTRQDGIVSADSRGSAEKSTRQLYIDWFFGRETKRHIANKSWTGGQVDADNVKYFSHPVFWLYLKQYVTGATIALGGIAALCIFHLSPSIFPLSLMQHSLKVSLVLAAVFLVGIGMVAWTHAKRMATYYVITTERIMRADNLLQEDPQTYQNEMIHGKDCTLPEWYHKFIFKYGTVKISTAGTDGYGLVWTGVNNPTSDVRNIITQVAENE